LGKSYSPHGQKIAVNCWCCPGKRIFATEFLLSAAPMTLFNRHTHRKTHAGQDVSISNLVGKIVLPGNFDPKYSDVSKTLIFDRCVPPLLGGAAFYTVMSVRLF
jgi:hypothetical protein